MKTPSKFSIGQPVKREWDSRNGSIGIVRAKYWVKMFETWGYWIRQSDGEEYIENEIYLTAVRFERVQLRRVA